MNDELIRVLEKRHPGYKVVEARVSTKDGAIDALSEKLSIEIEMDLVDAVEGAKDLDLVKLCSNSGYVTKEDIVAETLTEQEFYQRLCKYHIESGPIRNG